MLWADGQTCSVATLAPGAARAGQAASGEICHAGPMLGDAPDSPAASPVCQPTVRARSEKKGAHLPTLPLAHLKATMASKAL